MECYNILCVKDSLEGLLDGVNSIFIWNSVKSFGGGKFHLEGEGEFLPQA